MTLSVLAYVVIKSCIEICIIVWAVNRVNGKFL